MATISQKSNQKLTKILFLSQGECFEIPHLKETMRHLTLLHSNESGALVSGEFRENIHGSWKREKTRIASSVMVLPTGEFNKVNIIDGIVTIDGETTSQNSSASGKRGRKSRAENVINFPEKRDFTLRDFLNELNKTGKYEYHTIANAFNRVRDQFKQVGTIPNGGRGKPLIVWKKK